MRSITEVLTPRTAPALEYRRRWERRYHSRLVSTDVAIVTAAMGVGAAVLSVSRGAVPASAQYVVVLGAVWIAMLAALRTRDSGIVGGGIAEYRSVAHASGLALGAFALIGSALDWNELRLILFAAGPAGTLGLLFGRWSWRRWLRRQRIRGRFLSRTLVVGAEDDVRYVLGALREGGENAIFVVGVSLFDGGGEAAFMDDPAPAERRRTLSAGETDHPVFGASESVAETAARIGADKIIIASLPANTPDYVKTLSWQLEGTASELVLSHRVTDVVGPRISFRPIDGLPLLQIKIPRYEGGQHLLKRALDIAVASVALLGIALITPVVALCIKLDSRGPVLFWQDRVGRDGQRFRMLKFRTMQVDAEARRAELAAENEGAGPLFKLRRDPRVTRVGRVLRRLSLDELPQFWNVLTGDMSVVGPRPPLPDEVTSYDGTVFRRLYIKPGITGLWQVSGRSDLTWEQSVRLDLSYVENWSLMQDLQIMWRTAKVMIRPTGAY